jgi:hypothetical protein
VIEKCIDSVSLMYHLGKYYSLPSATDIEEMWMLR